MAVIIDFATCRVSVLLLIDLYIGELQKLSRPLTEREVEISLRSQRVPDYAVQQAISRLRFLEWRDGKPYFTHRPEEEKELSSQPPLFGGYFLGPVSLPDH